MGRHNEKLENIRQRSHAHHLLLCIHNDQAVNLQEGGEGGEGGGEGVRERGRGGGRGGGRGRGGRGEEEGGEGEGEGGEGGEGRERGRGGEGEGKRRERGITTLPRVRKSLQTLVETILLIMV